MTAPCLVQQADSLLKLHTHTHKDTHINFLFILQSKTPGDLLKLLKGRWDFGPDPLDFIPLKACVCDAFVPLCVSVCVRGAPMLSRTQLPRDTLLIRGKRGRLE